MNETVGTATASPSLLDLQSRVRAATGPDREIDAEIHAAAFGGAPAYRCSDSTRRSYGPGTVHEHDNGGFVKNAHVTSAYSSSIDAALELVERVLPGVNWEIQRLDEGDPEPWFDAQVGEALAQARSAPLAILDALLSALIAQSTSARKGAVLKDSTLLEKE